MKECRRSRDRRSGKLSKFSLTDVERKERTSLLTLDMRGERREFDKNYTPKMRTSQKECPFKRFILCILSPLSQFESVLVLLSLRGIEILFSSSNLLSFAFLSPASSSLTMATHDASQTGKYSVVSPFPGIWQVVFCMKGGPNWKGGRTDSKKDCSWEERTEG